MAKRRATTQAPDVGTVDSAMGGSRRGARKASGYAGRIESGGRGDLGDQALGENNRGTGGKGAPSTGFGAGAPGSTGGGDLGQGTGGGVVESTTPAYDQPAQGGDAISQSYLDGFQTGVEMTPEVDSSGSALPGRQPINPTYAKAPTSTSSGTPTTKAVAPGTQVGSLIRAPQQPARVAPFVKKAVAPGTKVGSLIRAPQQPARVAPPAPKSAPTVMVRAPQQPARFAPAPPPKNTVSTKGKKNALR